MNKECLERQCMADKEWTSINKNEYVCIHCPRFIGNVKDIEDGLSKNQSNRDD